MSSKDGQPIYSGIMDCVTKTLKNEGVMAFYKGTIHMFLLNLAGVILCKFWSSFMLIRRILCYFWSNFMLIFGLILC